MEAINSKLIGIGSYVPEFVLTNDILEQLVDTNDEWIVKRTGIRERRIAKGMHTWELGLRAAERALEDAGLTADALDMIIVTTCSPDFFSPIEASVIQDKLGAKCAAMDMNTCCSGFVYASDVADSFIKCGKAKTVMVISAETLSRVTDYTDRGTCVLLGDGAGAAIYTATEETDKGILSSFLSSDGSGAEYLYMEALPVEQEPLSAERFCDPKARFLKMAGAPVVRFTAWAVPKAIDEALHRAGLTAAEIDWVVPHQANLRILDVIAKKYNLPKEKIYVNLDRFGNTSSASIPLALAEMRQNGLLHEGQTLVCTGFGGGLTYGAFVIRL
ncbi:MAG: beta-ketoacyl-ACP synthase III [Eubacteriales bacterium]|nr:beta-ketoacyl-ACP synthase III [Eubacteriales bacterium]